MLHTVPHSILKTSLCVISLVQACQTIQIYEALWWFLEEWCPVNVLKLPAVHHLPSNQPSCPVSSQLLEANWYFHFSFFKSQNKLCSCQICISLAPAEWKRDRVQQELYEVQRLNIKVIEALKSTVTWRIYCEKNQKEKGSFFKQNKNGNCIFICYFTATATKQCLIFGLHLTNVQRRCQTLYCGCGRLVD